MLQMTGKHKLRKRESGVHYVATRDAIADGVQLLSQFLKRSELREEMRY
jgi:hypothetical protein